MMDITTCTLILFVLHGISHSSGISLFKDGFSGSEKISPLSQANSLPVAKLFEQKLDHFDGDNPNTWKQVVECLRINNLLYMYRIIVQITL